MSTESTSTGRRGAAHKIVCGVARGWLRQRGGAAPGRMWYLCYRVGERGRARANEVSMETAGLAEARLRARDFLTVQARAWSEGGDSKWAKLRESVSGTRGWVSVAKLLEVYCPAGSKASVVKNAGDLRAIVEQVTGDEVGRVSLARLNDELLLRWIVLRQEYQRLLSEREEAEEIRDATGWAEMVAGLRAGLAGRRRACVDGAVVAAREALELLGSDPERAAVVLRAAGSSWAAVAEASAPLQREVLALEGALEWGAIRRRADLPPLDVDKRLPGNATINSMMNHAQCVLGNRSTTFRLRGVDLPPGVASFCKVGRIAALPTGFVPIPHEAYAAMHAGSLALEREDPEVWRVNQLVRKLGLRAGEVVAARRGWLEVDGQGWKHARAGGMLLVVKDRPGEQFWVKSGAGKERFLPMDDGLVACLGSGSGEWLVGASRARNAAAVRRHNAWLRRFIPDRQKAGHELRKHVGALIYSSLGAAAAAEYLGHASPAVTVKYYAAWLNQLPVITGEDLAAAALRKGP